MSGGYGPLLGEDLRSVPNNFREDPQMGMGAIVFLAIVLTLGLGACSVMSVYISHWVTAN
jgi:hypothetical protein